jgi:HAL2 family 3'(2'),5'-bisphosphate nucleotidase
MNHLQSLNTMKLSHGLLCLVLTPTLVRSRSAFFSGISQTIRPQLSSLQATKNDELPIDFPRRDDVLRALAAVRRACEAIVPLQPERLQDPLQEGMSVVSKQDLSPVTVADFTAQAIVLHELRKDFSEDSFIAEESSTALQEDNYLAEQVLQATGLESLQLVKDSIDLGQQYNHWSSENNPRPSRVWCLDPIDGTKGFLRGRRDGGQYCVALALLEDGVPVIGILGCPNLPANPENFNYAWDEEEELENNNNQERGCIFVATRGGGCYQLSYRQGAALAVRLHVTPQDGAMTPNEARFCVGVEKFSDALGQCAGMAMILHGPEGALDDKGEIVLARRIDSQAKYGVLARAGAEYYVRLPKPGYVEWIWDHAAGYVVITEAGGTMTDTNDREIDFSLGAKLSDGVKGVLGSNGGVFHEALVDAFAKQEVERLQKLQ